MTSPSSNSSVSNPKAPMSISSIPSSSSASLSKSHSANSAVLLSASLKAFTCSGVKSSALIAGTVSSPNSCAAFSLVCPATITLSRSITNGTFHPNSFMDSATLATASSLILGLFSYGFRSLTEISNTSMNFPPLYSSVPLKCLYYTPGTPV